MATWMSAEHEEWHIIHWHTFEDEQELHIYNVVQVKQ